MKKTLVIFAVVALLGIMAAYVDPLGSHTHNKSVLSPTASTASGTSSQALSASNTSSGSSSSTSSASSAYKDGTFTGRDEPNDYGDVQIAITISGGKISDVKFLQLPSGGRSSEISGFAAPQLKSQTLSAQNANIDGVSGASYTSASYVQSLQSALDQAKA